MGIPIRKLAAPTFLRITIASIKTWLSCLMIRQQAEINTLQRCFKSLSMAQRVKSHHLFVQLISLRTISHQSGEMFKTTKPTSTNQALL